MGMRYGKIAGTLLGIVGGVILLMLILQPG
jgi:hypothetical protein